MNGRDPVAPVYPSRQAAIAVGACPAAKHAHVHEPSGLALVALTKRGQVPLQRPCTS
jgi:hypothetical protein